MLNLYPHVLYIIVRCIVYTHNIVVAHIPYMHGCMHPPHIQPMCVCTRTYVCRHALSSTCSYYQPCRCIVALDISANLTHNTGITNYILYTSYISSVISRNRNLTNTISCTDNTFHTLGSICNECTLLL